MLFGLRPFVYKENLVYYVFIASDWDMLKKPTNKDVLKEILNQKASYSDVFLTIKYKKNNSRDSKKILIVPASVSKKAVVRNKIKRRSRDVLSRIEALERVNLAVFFKKGVETLSFDQLRERLLEAVKNIK